MKKILLAATIISASTAGAMAADLPSRKTAPVYAAAAPVMSWTGFYLGANLGYGWMDRFNKQGLQNVWTGVGWVQALVPFSGDPHGGLVGGVQAGYNYQLSPMFVIGGEADIQATSVGGGQIARRVPWFSTIRGRIGVTPFSPNLLVYATGGFALGDLSIGPFFDGFKPTKLATGWTAGGGLEYAFAGNWSAKLEYLITNIGRSDWGGAFGHVPERVHTHTVRLGLNYHFYSASVPVVAKY